MASFLWLAAMAVFLAIEIVTMGLTTIWFAGGALASFVLSLFHVPVLAQIVVFLAVSIILIVFTRPVVERRLNESRESTNAGSIIGREGKVVEDIDNFNQKGAVAIGGLEWTARSSEDGLAIPAGTKVKVDKIEGVKAFVTPSDVDLDGADSQND